MITEQGTNAGTLRYIAPGDGRVMTRMRETNFRWAELITGRHAFDAENSANLICLCVERRACSDGRIRADHAGARSWHQ